MCSPATLRRADRLLDKYTNASLHCARHKSSARPVSHSSAQACARHEPGSDRSPPSMESTRPIRALLRGLDALVVLNLRDGATVAEVASDIRLPRTTTYRVLETLAHAGYVLRDPGDDRYRLTRLVRGFSDAFDEEAWVAQIAKPYLYELCRDIVWPVAIATLSGTAMLVRETADPRTPFAVERFSAAFRVPLLTTALGLAYLGHSPQGHRAKLL